MKKVKEFFSKKKFDRQSTGHKLGTAESASSPSQRSSDRPQASSSLSSSSSLQSSSSTTARVKTAAAEAAERRAAQQLEKSKVKLPRSYLPPPEKIPEEEEKRQEETEEKHNEDDSHKFNCPGLEIVDYHPFAKLKNLIMETIKSNFGEDSVICGSLLILNCNTKDKADVCISTLEAILKNLITDDDEKFAKFTKIRKIKIENKILSVNGGLEFLNGAGFTLSDDGEWFVFNDSKDGIEEKVNYYIDVLTSSVAFPIVLDREANIYDLSGLNTPNIDFDDKVFEMTKDELTREQQSRKEIADREMTLMTKAMRDRYINKKPKTRYTRLRYKRLDLKMIEATFRTNETINDLLNWLKENHSMPEIENYDIACGTKIIPIEDWNKTFLDLDFYPKVTFYQRLRTSD